MQTTFNVSPPAGMPGMPFDNGYKDVRSFPALHDIPFGVLCELNTTGTVQAVQDSGTAGSFLPVLAGVSMYNPMHEQAYVGQGGTAGAGYWRAGEMVPCMRRGRMWAAFDGGGTWPEYAAVRVWHSSDGTHSQGVFTMTANSTTAGAEIDTAPSGVIGVEKALAQGSYTDGFGNSLTAAVISLNLG